MEGEQIKEGNEEDECLTINIEHTKDFESWRPVLLKMIKGDIIVEAFYGIPFEDDFIMDKVEKETCYIQLTLFKTDFYRWLDFFRERARKGDIISVYRGAEELNKLIEGSEEQEM